MSAGATELQRRDTWLSMTAVGVLLLLHFLLHPWLTGLPAGPDLLIGGLLLAALRVRAGAAAVLGFALGPLEAAMLLDDPGVYALVLTATGYVAARSRDVLFADAAMFVIVYLFLGTWITRVSLMLILDGSVGWASFAGAGVNAVATAVVCGFVDALGTSFVRRA